MLNIPKFHETPVKKYTSRCCIKIQNTKLIMLTKYCMTEIVNDEIKKGMKRESGLQSENH